MKFVTETWKPKGEKIYWVDSEQNTYYRSPGGTVTEHRSGQRTFWVSWMQEIEVGYVTRNEETTESQTTKNEVTVLTDVLMLLWQLL